MIRTTVALALLFCLPATLFAGSQSSSAPHDQEAIRAVVDLERQSKDAAIRRDVSFVERTLAEDYVGIGPLGAVVTKADTVAAAKLLSCITIRLTYRRCWSAFLETPLW